MRLAFVSLSLYKPAVGSVRYASPAVQPASAVDQKQGCRNSEIGGTVAHTSIYAYINSNNDGKMVGKADKQE